MKRSTTGHWAVRSSGTGARLSEPQRAGYSAAAQRAARRSTAFSLIELLIVLGIIGILAAISLPALRGLGKSNSTDSAAQQLVDDLALARSRAINGRTIVHVVFVPTNMMVLNVGPSTYAQSVQARLIDGGFRTYGFFSNRSIGDQPGRPQPQYMEDWRTLPDGVLLAKYEYEPEAYNVWLAANPTNRPLDWIQIPFPTEDALPNWVPHIAFGPEGGLVDSQGERVFGAEFIEVANGSVLSGRDDAGNQVTPPDWMHAPTQPGSEIRIRVDGFTGKAQVVKPEIQ